MEEQHIQEFVHRAVTDVKLRSELAVDPVGAIERSGYSARVMAILLRLVPCLTFEQALQGDAKWWHA